METTNPMYPGNDPKYKDLKQEEIPQTECLKVRGTMGKDEDRIWHIWADGLDMRKYRC